MYKWRNTTTLYCCTQSPTFHEIWLCSFTVLIIVAYRSYDRPCDRQLATQIANSFKKIKIKLPIESQIIIIHFHQIGRNT